MATVKELLDGLVGGTVTLEQVAEDFAGRTWPAQKRPTDGQAWGVLDDDAPDPDSWDAVNACSALTAEQYNTLAAAAAATK